MNLVISGYIPQLLEVSLVSLVFISASFSYYPQVHFNIYTSKKHGNKIITLHTNNNTLPQIQNKQSNERPL